MHSLASTWKGNCRDCSGYLVPDSDQCISTHTHQQSKNTTKGGNRDCAVSACSTADANWVVTLLGKALYPAEFSDGSLYAFASQAYHV